MAFEMSGPANIPGKRGVGILGRWVAKWNPWSELPDWLVTPPDCQSVGVIIDAVNAETPSLSSLNPGTDHLAVEEDNL